MNTYVILTKLAADAFRDPAEFPGIAKMVSEKIKADCPQVVWKESYAVTGTYDILDVVEAPDVGSVERACMIIRGYGHGTTQTLVATPWADFLEGLGGKKSASTVGTA
ncbi:MAG TPA: GYD domain-containing protein [Candidatus Baltobacteraceae bacterium]|nr:GYD domain-containing protein [Candidatus Baltobacteraceae bacterium]